MFNNHRVVVSMTSWTKRIGNCYSVVKSILDGSVKPDIVFLNLSISEFPKREANLPSDLAQLSKTNPEFKIYWVPGPNVKTMKKVFPILKYLDDEDIILYIDDDILYPRDYVQSRLLDFKKFNQPISGNPWEVFKGCNPPLLGTVGNSGLLQKKMLNGYEKYLTKRIISTYNDDTQYAVLCYMNGYVQHESSKYKTSDLRKYHTFNNVLPSHERGVYKMSEHIQGVVDESLKKNFGCGIKTAYGILNDGFRQLDMCYITDDKYVDLTCKSIKSLCYSVNDNTQYNVHVICDRVSDGNKALLRSNKRSNVSIELMDFDSTKYIPEALLKNRGDKITHVSNAALIKFNLCRIFSDLDRILYVDGDIVFVGDPVKVCNYDLGNNYLAACLDDFAFDSKQSWEAAKKERGYPPDYVKMHDMVIQSGSAYVNSGVMYMNLKQMREDGMSQRLMEFKQSTKTYFVDQDTFNVCFKNRILLLPVFFNFFRKYRRRNDCIAEMKKRYSGYSNRDIIAIHIAERNVDKRRIMNDVFNRYHAKK